MISSSPSWMWVVIGAGLFLVFLEILGRRKLKWHSLFRIIWIVALGILVADWMSVRNQEFSQPSLIHIAYDRSDSIGKIAERRDNTQKFLKEAQAWATQSKQPVKFLSLAENVVEGFSEDKSFSGLQTLVSPLKNYLENQEGVTILLSDGNFQDRALLPQKTYAVQVGRGDDKDVWIDFVQPVYTAFLKNRVKIPISIAQSGFSGSRVQISLWRGLDKVDEQVVRLAESRTNIELSVFPEKMGEAVYIVRLEPLDGELSPINNEYSFRLRTVRDKMRILHIGGRPTQDLKAWRLFLTRQPDVDLVSFYILRSLNDDPQARNHELSLIPFPYEDLFSTELEKVDLVILQNFDFNLYFQPFYLSNLAAFIRRGGALLIIGGDQSFQRYYGSPLEPLFPFLFGGMGNLERVEEGITKIAPHPIVSGSEALLRNLPLTAHHLVWGQPDSTNLAEYKSGKPFLSIREVGKGRVMALNSDESWKLQTKPSDDPAGFSRLARRMVQYLTFDPEMDPQRLISNKWRTGKKVELKLAKSEKSTWRITPLSRFQPDLKSLEISEAEMVSYEIPHPGWYLVENSLLSEPMIFETEEKPWQNEWKKLLSSSEVLEKMAADTGGKFLDYDDRRELFSLALSGKQVISSEVTPFTRGAGSWAWIILFSSLFAMFMDFLLRKRSQWDA